MKGEEAEQQFNKLVNCNLKVAVDEASGQEDNEHTSGGVLISTHGALPSVVNDVQVQCERFQAIRRSVQAWVCVKEGLQVFAIHC